jgi:hypothetical protein
MTKDELQEIADMYGLYTEQDVENRVSCELLGIGARNEELEKENAELKAQLDAIDKAGEHVRQQINDAFRNKKPYWELEKENAELKVLLDCKNCSELSEEECEVCAEASHFKCKGKDQLAKAIGIIKRWYETNRSACIEPSKELIEVTEQFIRETEK